jgi:hypothetical protein
VNPKSSSGDEQAAQQPAPEVETAEGHTGSDHVSHGANTNLTPAAAPTGADAEAAETVLRQHQDKGS